MMRRIVALFGHAPGLWLVYREALPEPARRPNVIAAALTVLAMGGAALVAPAEHRGLAVLATWLVGHFAWGTWLFGNLPPPTAKP